MTKSQALAEARRRWGKYAWVKREAIPSQFDRYNAWYEVGHLDTVLITDGAGSSWEEAFADADRREKGEGT